jgi:hypothetical protein
VQCVICGGIEETFYRFFNWKKITVIDGVIGSHGEAMQMAFVGSLRPGQILPSAKKST